MLHGTVGEGCKENVFAFIWLFEFKEKSQKTHVFWHEYVNAQLKKHICLSNMESNNFPHVPNPH